MKKIFALGIVVLAVVCLGLTACGKKGGDLKLINDTMTVRYFRILFDGKEQKVNDGSFTIVANQTVNAHSDEDTTYSVYRLDSSGKLVDGSNALFAGNLSGGETVELRLSTIKFD